jgi:hypothetical protein
VSEVPVSVGCALTRADICCNEPPVINEVPYSLSRELYFRNMPFETRHNMVVKSLAGKGKTKICSESLKKEFAHMLSDGWTQMKKLKALDFRNLRQSSMIGKDNVES